MGNLNVFGREYAPLYFEREWLACKGVAVRLTELFYSNGERKRVWGILEGDTEFRDAAPEEVSVLESALNGRHVFFEKVKQSVFRRIELECGLLAIQYAREAEELFNKVTFEDLYGFTPTNGDKIHGIKMLRNEYKTSLHVAKIIIEVLLSFLKRKQSFTFDDIIEAVRFLHNSLLLNAELTMVNLVSQKITTETMFEKFVEAEEIDFKVTPTAFGFEVELLGERAFVLYPRR